jgi:hypothetical protein
LSLATIAPPLYPGIDEQFMFYPTRAQMDPASIWLRRLMLETGHELDRDKRKAAYRVGKAQVCPPSRRGLVWMVGTAQERLLPTLRPITLELRTG